MVVAVVVAVVAVAVVAVVAVTEGLVLSNWWLILQDLVWWVLVKECQ